MTDPRIKTGDVCIDLVERGKLQVVSKAADTVREHREREDFDLAEYKAHPLLDVREDEPVYECVYLSSDPSVSYSRTYDFPRSRLARQPVEEADENLERVQESLVVSLLEALFATADRDDMASSMAGLVDVAVHAGIDDELVSAAEELAEVEDHFEDGGSDG